MSGKTIEQLEEERMARFANVPAQDRQTAAWKKPAAEPAVVAQPAATPKTWQPKPAAPKPAPVQQASAPAPSKWQPQPQASNGAQLTGTMDLSTRVQYLNSLLEQGSIDENEYQTRAEPLQVANSIISACSTGDVRSLEQLINENPLMNMDAICEKEATPLSIAVSSAQNGRGNSKILSLLLSKGAQPNRRKNGFTPLLTLCERANFADAVNCARVLIEGGADAKATTIVPGKEPISCISLAVKSNANSELIRLLCQNGASPNDLLDPHGPILVNCIIEEQLETASVLLQCGADPNGRQTGLGASCLAIAINNRHVQIVEQLIQHGGDRDAPIMRDHKTSARQLVAELAKKEPAAFQRIERFF